MIETAGGINITKGLNRSYAKIDPEEVVFQDPEVIILTYMKNREWVDDKFAKRIGFSAIDAVKNDRVFSDLNPDIILRPGPRVDEGLLMLHERFYED